MLPPVFTWVFMMPSQPVEKIPQLVTSGGLSLTGEVTLGQIGVVVAIVWSAAKVFFPLLARIDRVESACSKLSGEIEKTNSSLNTVKDVQIAQGGMLQRMIGQLEGEKLLRQGISVFRPGGQREGDS